MYLGTQTNLKLANEGQALEGSSPVESLDASAGSPLSPIKNGR